MTDRAPIPPEETIAAIVSGVGGAVSIVRLSGPAATALADRLWQGRSPLKNPPWREMRLGELRDGGDLLDAAVLAVHMPGPRSYTGDDVVEFHLHGGVVTARRVLEALLKNGARHAEPGEFTRRAFLNGKLDLTQAEAVGDLISAHSDTAARLAGRQLEGALRRRAEKLYGNLAGVLAEIESRLDFPDEELDWQATGKLLQAAGAIGEEIRSLLASQRAGELLREGIRLVIAGPPNAGKSSLMNAILGRDRAIVTHIPGTTRDLLEESVQIRGLPVRLVDTAGLRDTGDIVEQAGIERSLASLRTAQIVLWITDATCPAPEPPPEFLRQTSLIRIANKSDLLPPGTRPPPDAIAISAQTGAGLEGLYARIEALAWQGVQAEEPEAAINARHAAHLEIALKDLADAQDRLRQEEWELAAVTLRSALEGIGRITGRTASHDILDDIFSRFCLGK